MDALPLLLSLLLLLFLPHCHPAKVVERGIPAVLFPDKDAIRVPTSSVFPLTGSRSFTEPTYPVNRNTILQRLLNVGFKRKEALAAMEEELHDLDHSFDYLAAIHNEPTNEVLPCIGSERCFRKTNDELYEESVKSAAFLQLKMQVRARRFRRQLQQRRESLLEEAVPLDCARFRSLNEDETVSQAPALLEVTSGRRRRHRKKFLGKIGKGIRKLANKVGSFVGKLFRKKPPAAAPPAKKAEAPPAAADPPVTPPLKETPGAPFESSSSMTLNNLRLNKVKYNRNEIISPVNVNVTETPHDAHNPEAAEASEEEPTVTSPTTGESSESTESSESSGANETASEPPRPAHLLKTQEPFVATLRSRIACAQQSTHVPGPPAWLRKSLRRTAKELEAEPKPPAGQRNSLAWPAIVPIRTKVINGIRRPNFETPPEAQAIPLDQVRPPTEQPSSLAMTPPPPPDPVQPGQVNANANTGTVPDATADGTAQETP